MKILHVVPTYIPAWRYGGPIHAVHGLCKALASQGHEVHVFTSNVDGHADSDVPINAAVDIDGVKVWYFPSKHLRRLYYSPLMMRSLKTRVSEFEIVHLHSVFLWPTWAAARVARHANIPYLISPHGMLVKDLIRRKSRWIKKAWLSLIEKKNIEQASEIHVTAETEKDELQKFAFKLPEICHVPNGVEMAVPWSMDEVSEDVRTTINEGDFVLYLGRINWKKGLDRLIKVWGEVPSTRLIVAGNDEEDYVSELQAMAVEADVSDRVFFLARSIRGADKEALFNKAILFVLPSYSENFGITVLEAMIRECPVVVTPEVGAAEIVLKAGAGMVVDAEGLAPFISRLLEENQARCEMGLRGKEWAEKNYTWKVIGEQVLDCYREVLERKG